MVTGGAAVLFYAIHCMRQPLRFCKHTLHSVEEHHTCLKYLKNSTSHWISLRGRPIWSTACEFERIVVLQRISLLKCISVVQCTVRETLNWPLEEVGVWWIDQEALGHHSSPPLACAIVLHCALCNNTRHCNPPDLFQLWFELMCQESCFEHWALIRHSAVSPWCFSYQHVLLVAISH